MSDRRQNSNSHFNPAMPEARAAMRETPVAHFRETR